MSRRFVQLVFATWLIVYTNTSVCRCEVTDIEQLSDLFKKVTVGHAALAQTASQVEGSISCSPCDDKDHVGSGAAYSARFAIDGQQFRLDFDTKANITLKDVAEQEVLLQTPTATLRYFRTNQRPAATIYHYSDPSNNPVRTQLNTLLRLPLSYSYMFGNELITNLMQLPVIGLDTVDGLTKLTVKASDDNKIQIWLDPTMNYAVRRLEQDRVDAGYRTVAKYKIDLSEFGKGRFAVSRASVEAVQSSVDDIGGKPLLSDCRKYDIQIAATAPQPSQFQESSLTSLGEYVVVEVSPTGRATVPDEYKLPPATGPLSRPLISWQRYFFIGLNVLIVVFLGCALIWRLRHR